MRPLLLAAVTVAVAADPLYDFSDSPLIKLDDSNFESLVVKDDKYLWVVEYYADWCGHCKQFAKGYQKAATNLAGIVKFGAVNADEAKKTQQAAGVQGFPSVKLYVPGSGGKNPYTGKVFKPAVEYKGDRTARGVVDFATATLPSLVVPVTDKSLAKFQSNGTLPKALLFTKKAETTPLLKSLSLALKGRMLFGEARETAEKAVAEMGIALFPTLVVLKEEGTPPLVYEGELKPAALAAFLEEHAAAPAEAPSDEGGDEPVEEDSLALKVDKSNLGDVEDERDAWILVFAGSETKALSGLAPLAEALYGQVKVATASADLADKFGVKLGPEPALVVWPFRKAGKKRAGQPFAGDEAGVAAAKKAALESLPDTYVEKLTSTSMDRWMQEAMMSSEAGAFAILFSDKPSVPPLYRAISLEFDGKLAFGFADANDKTIAPRFNVQKAPTLLVMFPDESKKDESGQVPLTGMQFTPQMHGKFNFGNIANFMSQVVQMRAQQKGGPAADAPNADEPPKPKAERPKKDLGPLPELNAETFDADCISKGGLCAIALLDGSPENSGKEANIEMLTKLRAKKAGGALSFSWVDATCHVGFASAFGLSEMDLPTMIFLSPSKLRWARSVGGFDGEALNTFGNAVATGRKGTDTLSELPSFEDVDCATIKRGAAAYEEEDDGADDIMAEILEEERRKKEALDAELAAEAASAASDTAAPEKKKKGDMSKLEKLESEIEECGSMDLLCAARREKQLKAYEKQRALEEKLAEIAKKKKKKAKKAKKAAGA